MSASFWWVNHSHTVRHEIEGSYLWFANKARKSKARSESDKNIQRLLPGDIVYSFADGAIGTIGVVIGSAREAAKPLEFDSIAQFADTQKGWLAPVRFMPLANPLRVEEHSAELTPVLPRKHSPLLAGGASNQHIVLAPVPSLMATCRGLPWNQPVSQNVGASHSTWMNSRNPLMSGRQIGSMACNPSIRSGPITRGANLAAACARSHKSGRRRSPGCR